MQFIVRFALDSIIWLPHHHDLSLHAHTSVHCPILLVSCVIVTVVRSLTFHVNYGSNLVRSPVINFIIQVPCFFCINGLCNLLIEQYCLNI